MTDSVLHRNKKRALAALLISRSVTEAAQSIGLSDRQFYRYLEDPVFRTALTQAEGALIEDAARRLLSGQAAALDALETLISSAEREADRRLAAIAWLDLVLKWRELRNVETRLAALEEEVFSGKHQ